MLLAIGALLTGAMPRRLRRRAGLRQRDDVPAIFLLAIRGLGLLHRNGSALLVMGISGGAVVPQLFALFGSTTTSRRCSPRWWCPLLPVYPVLCDARVPPAGPAAGG